MTLTLAQAPLVAAVLIFLMGMAILLFKRNLIKILMGVTLMEAGVNLFLVSLGYRVGGIAPIYTLAPEAETMVMPTVQALTLTAIVIGVATTALMLSFVMTIYRHYGTTNVRRVKEWHG